MKLAKGRPLVGWRFAPSSLNRRSQLIASGSAGGSCRGTEDGRTAGVKKLLTGTLETIAAKLPNGFHDSELEAVVVDWRNRSVTLRGIAWMALEGPPEVYRAFELRAEGLCSFVHPECILVHHSGDRPESILEKPVRIDGFPGWPPDRAPEANPCPNAPAYTFFVTDGTTS